MQQQEGWEEANVRPAAAYELVYIIQAYNGREITFEEWLKLAREWAERMLRQRQQGGSE